MSTDKEMPTRQSEIERTAKKYANYKAPVYPHTRENARRQRQIDRGIIQVTA